MVANVSQAFHDAIKQGVPQRALLLFDNYIFTNDDIAASAGLEFDEYFNSEQDLTIGLCPSSTLKFTVLNYENLFENFQGGPFEAYLGVMTAQQTYTRYEDELCRVVLPNGTVLSGHSTQPYLREDGIAAQVQPEYAVCSIVGFDGIYYLLGTQDRVLAYVTTADGDYPKVLDTWGELQNLLPDWKEARRLYTYARDSAQRSVAGFLFLDPRTFDPEQATEEEREALAGRNILPANDFLLHKARAYVTRRSGVDFSSVTHDLTEWRGGGAYIFEYAPLGHFITERPRRVRTKLVEVEAFDQMALLDTELNGFVPSSRTLKGLFRELCNHYGVPSRTDAFPANDSMPLSDSDIPGTQGVTGRQFLSWIAQAACGVARFDRDGRLGIDAFSPQTLRLDESDYSSFVPAEYSVPAIDKLQVRNGSDADIGTIIGDGNNAYIIQDNPFLLNKEAEATAIFNRLRGFGGYIPGEASWLTADWSYQAGDIVTVSQGETEYRLPIFVQKLRWGGSAKITLEATGSEVRDPLSAVNRMEYRFGRTVHEVENTVNEFYSRIYTTDDSGETILSESFIRQLEDEITLSAESIKLEGYVTANGTFTIDTSGFLRCTGGTIGGVTIGENALYTGSHSTYSSTENGIYIGSSGISLGSQFKVDNQGNLVASSGTFSGNVYAGNIQYGGNYGTMSGSAITGTSIPGGKLVDGAVGTDKIAGGAVNTDQLASSAVKNAKIYNGAVDEKKCDQTINNYFSDVITANKMLAGQMRVESLWAGTIKFGTLISGNSTVINHRGSDGWWYLAYPD